MKIKFLARRLLLLFVLSICAQFVMASGLQSEQYSINISKISMVAGWIGTVLYILAYLLLCLGKLTAGSKCYHLLNILGALGLIINAADMKDYPSFVVNIIWMIIAGITLWLLIKKGMATGETSKT
ncbi:hypothetical protein GCM10027566_27840 [Arachidicoccus ginsenosidivorans]|jgi:hypothetical protein|uniref:CBU_0592 family membrane protein n=1 Tax=Arachidicoccus ginsenosidivorans TaxID=496057 RepID=UPI001864B9F4|nr:hypothetical protein [Arachidicoccus ginsenosidivorans]